MYTTRTRPTTKKVCTLSTAKNCEKKYIGETKRKLKIRVKEHREEVERIEKKRIYTREGRRQSETEM